MSGKNNNPNADPPPQTLVIPHSVGPLGVRTIWKAAMATTQHHPFRRFPGASGVGGVGPNMHQGHSNSPYNSPMPPRGADVVEKRGRKAIQRRTVDYNSVLMKWLEDRALQRNWKDYSSIVPDVNYILNIQPPFAYTSNYATSLCTKFVHTSTNKIRCPINAVRWTPEGRRLITGASSGEFTLWNGLTFNFETILQAHDSAVRTMTWSHNDTWLITGDDSGVIKYWQSNMNNLKAFTAHKETVRDLTFSPTDAKYASCSDDGTIKIWSFADAIEERTLTGHGWDVKCLDWHPTKGLLASGSKDNLAKLWDPKTGKALSTLHGHKNTILGIEWNKNGNWLVTASRDQLLRVFDIRTMRELQSFRGHKKDVQSVAWHPHHESLFASGGSDGSIMYWHVGIDHHVAAIPTAHESSVFALDWHPMGHILVSGSNDHTTRFWTRCRPGEAESGVKEVSNGTAGHEEDGDEDDGGNDWHATSGLPGLGSTVPGLGGSWSNRDNSARTGGSAAGMGQTPGALPGLGREGLPQQSFNQNQQFSGPGQAGPFPPTMNRPSPPAAGMGAGAVHPSRQALVPQGPPYPGQMPGNMRPPQPMPYGAPPQQPWNRPPPPPGWNGPPLPMQPPPSQPQQQQQQQQQQQWNRPPMPPMAQATGPPPPAGVTGLPQNMYGRPPPGQMPYPPRPGPQQGWNRPPLPPHLQQPGNFPPQGARPPFPPQFPPQQIPNFPMQQGGAQQQTPPRPPGPWGSQNPYPPRPSG